MMRAAGRRMLGLVGAGLQPTTSLTSLTSLHAAPLQHLHTQQQAPHEHRGPAGGLLAAAAAAVLAAASMVSAGAEAPPSAQQLPSYSKEEVSKHRTKEQRIWVTYKDGVYDVTDFVEGHPGGKEKIMMAAGGSVEPFWAIYQQHMHADVQAMLKPWRVGSLAGYKSGAGKGAEAGADPWKAEPSRHPSLIERSSKPCNAETPGAILAAHLITPTDIFYVRNHLPVPPPEPADPDAWQLAVGGEGARAVTLSLKDLKTQFKKTTITATLECSGNRRNEMSRIKQVKGLEWDIGAIGTATWSGVLLRDVLLHAGLDPDAGTTSEGPQHVHFVGADTDPLAGTTYGASIPIETALAANKDVLLAYEMNGEPLSRDHGAPLRVVCPGIVGARSVKWLTSIQASTVESPSHWQQRDYKGFSPSVDWDTVDWDSAPAIQEAPVTSAITEPQPGTRLPAGTKEVTVRGYAWSGGGREVIRVDVSADGGATWQPTQLRKVPGQRPGRAWAWTLWEAEVSLPQRPAPAKPAAGGPRATGKAAAPAGPAAVQEVQLVVKATDASYNTQPDGVAGVWNLRGVINNAWHRSSVVVEA